MEGIPPQGGLKLLQPKENRVKKLSTIPPEKVGLKLLLTELDPRDPLPPIPLPLTVTLETLTEQKIAPTNSGSNVSSLDSKYVPRGTVEQGNDLV